MSPEKDTFWKSLAEPRLKGCFNCKHGPDCNVSYLVCDGYTSFRQAAQWAEDDVRNLGPEWLNLWEWNGEK